MLRVIRHPRPGLGHPRGAVVAIGNFDGVHLGHAAVVERTRSLAQASGAPSAVLTFEPHPRSVLRPDTEPFRLTPFRVKEREMQRLGLDLLFVQHFDRDFAARSAEAFIDDIIIGGVGAGHIVVGNDFVFGHNRSGNVELLRRYGESHGFAVTIVEPVRRKDGVVFSATGVREALLAGHPREAAALLGRFWEINGRVAEGDKRGRTIGFPTANMGLADYLRPAFGVYAVRVSGEGPHDPLDGRRLDGVANLGWRPTVGGQEPRLETHLFDYAGDLYGRALRVELVEFIRPEQKFAGIDALKAQIAADAAQARILLGAQA